MDAIYRQLCRDHKHMQQLLDAFEKLLHQLGRNDRDPATLGLILDALDYLSVYPDKWHHPAEELVFARLLTKPIHDRDGIYKAQMQHERIAAATKNMSALFYAVANDAAVERHTLVGTCNDYLRLQRDHMELENRTIFPQIEMYLTDQDWDFIRTQLCTQQDPLFNDDTRKIYESLRQYLTEPQNPEVAVA
ncbi:hemerythrin domain-containing protein [Microbulbifer marinus]|uniref:Hemerythrin-like domain-containing protein n=1 Tax=Microbulbifer marinus TaxID=658218 RepID=A0A1H4BCZ3_9GAMM|nr:hemerythrin domain-containing protein [Microbulbifer marinus]SEA45924.1 Hemerythrin-like domain-containing protein [Microbulbifer marinus]